MTGGRAWVLVLGLMACGSPDPVETGDTNDDGGVDCGDREVVDLRVTGLVVDGSGAPIAGAEVSLVDRGWEPGTVLGTGTSDASGGYAMDVVGLTSIDGCWGTVLNYRLEGTSDGRIGEKAVNQYLFTAIDNGSFEADISDFPLVLE